MGHDIIGRIRCQLFCTLDWNGFILLSTWRVRLNPFLVTGFIFFNVVFNYQFLLVIILFGCILPSVCEGVAMWSIKLDKLPSFGSPSKFSGQETPFLDVIKNRRHPSVWNGLETVLPAGLEVNCVTLTFI